jgi:5S rRNA maturation endonuclease (ribonuclease M5)
MEELNELINQLKSEISPIIVEGKKDKMALERLGIHNIHPLSGKPLFHFVESFGNSSRVILLLDYDKAGRKLQKQLLQGFQRIGVKVDLSYHRKLKKTKLSHIEGLAKYMERRGDVSGKNCARFS